MCNWKVVEQVIPAAKMSEQQSTLAGKEEVQSQSTLVPCDVGKDAWTSGANVP